MQGFYSFGLQSEQKERDWVVIECFLRPEKCERDEVVNKIKQEVMKLEPKRRFFSVVGQDCEQAGVRDKIVHGSKFIGKRIDGKVIFSY